MKTTNRSLLRSTVAALALGTTACTGSGTVTFTTYGEDYIEKALPAAQGTTAGFVDGWELTYEKFLVVIREIEVSDADGKSLAKQANPKLFDVHKAGPVDIEKFENLPAEKLPTVTYAIAPPTDLVPGNATADDVTLMKSKGYSVLLKGSAKKGAVTKSFEWGFTTNTQYLACRSEELGEGVTVPSGGNEAVQLTIHGDHPFFDDLQSPEAKLRFEAIANADKGLAGLPGDGVITLEELAAVDLTTLPTSQYGTGGASSVRNLKEFVTALIRTIGHYRGEGECSPKVR